ncbi:MULTISPECIES: hypothetical protein [Stenotrophomonas]|uniref:hypothetical protein n=1 Tax=Stenotrophomonas TaxID=40323 RepID=UPI0008731AEB|nr:MULTISPECIES: hypothetical protein [Stenotrophomonas]
MKTAFALAVTFAALTAVRAEATTINLSDSVQIEPITTVSTQELWSTAASKSVESGVVIVEQLDIDPEAARMRGGWRSCTLISVGTSDLGIKPVAVRVWTLQPCDVSISVVRAPNAPGEEKFLMRIDRKQNFTIHVTGNQKVTISDVELGSIDY